MSAHEYCRHDIRLIECKECKDPLPTSAEVARADEKLWGMVRHESGLQVGATIHELCAAQHAATRKAVLEEVYQKMVDIAFNSPDEMRGPERRQSLLDWLTQQLTEVK